MDAKKRVVIELPPRGELGDPINRHEPELEVFGTSVDLVEVDSNPTVLPRSPLERWQPYSMDRGPSR